MGWILWLFCAALALCLLYCFLTAPNLLHRKLDFKRFTTWDYAHRGLHDIKRGCPENSLAAFEKACKAGYGIELDVRVTRDNVLVVHHDETLERSCGDKRRVCDVPLAELQSMRLFDTDERVPTFDDTLSLVDGRVPLIVELKTDYVNASLAPQVHERLSRYAGLYCVESFDPRAMQWFKRHAPAVVRGQLACMPDIKGKPIKEKLRRLALGYLLVDFFSRPDFIAYGYKTDANFSFRFVANVFRPLLVAWTVRDAETFHKLSAYYDIQIFEQFRAERNARQSNNGN